MVEIDIGVLEKAIEGSEEIGEVIKIEGSGVCIDWGAIYGMVITGGRGIYARAISVLEKSRILSLEAGGNWGLVSKDVVVGLSKKSGDRLYFTREEDAKEYRGDRDLHLVQYLD